MNVTLTFSVFFGPLAIGLLVGCGSMKNYEFSQINERIEWDQYKLHQLQNNLSEINTERARLGDFLDYANSPAGKKYYTNAQCRLPAPARIAVASNPVEPCVTHIGQSQSVDCQTNGNCGDVAGALDSNQQPILSRASHSDECTKPYVEAGFAERSDEMVTVIAGALCVAGPGKLPLWARVPSPGKVLIEGAMRLTRSFACARTVTRLGPSINNKVSCAGKSTSTCGEKFTDLKSDDSVRLHSAQQYTSDNLAELNYCKSIAVGFPGLDRFAAQDRWAALDNRAEEIITDIELTQNAIRDAQAQKVSVKAKHKAYQEYTPTDPG